MIVAPSRTVLRRTILFIALAVASGFAPNAYAQSPCPLAARIFKSGETTYCVIRAPIARGEIESAESFQARERIQDERLSRVEDLIDVQFTADHLELFSAGDGSTTSTLEKIKQAIVRLCEFNSCETVPLLKFPPKVQMNRTGLLEFIYVAAARSVDVQASADILDMAYLSRLRQMKYAMELLSSFHFDQQQIAAR